jgi:predicted transposase YbfD/YdcC
VEARIELRDRCTVERRFYISSAPLSAARCAQAVRAHWRIESAPQAQERKVRDELTDRAQAA